MAEGWDTKADHLSLGPYIVFEHDEFDKDTSWHPYIRELHSQDANDAVVHKSGGVLPLARPSIYRKEGLHRVVSESNVTFPAVLYLIS